VIRQLAASFSFPTSFTSGSSPATQILQSSRNDCRHCSERILCKRQGRIDQGQEMTNKRMLKQQYLETKIRAGVYAIRNLVTGRVLVAGSTNVHAVLNRHRFELRQGTHRNPLLKQDWSLHGESSFNFDVLDMVKPREDSAFDVMRELDDLVALWRLEIPYEDERDYEFYGRTS
jgi:DNA-directed RNA polymerase subunit RPC12/RpoP